MPFGQMLNKYIKENEEQDIYFKSVIFRLLWTFNGLLQTKV